MSSSGFYMTTFLATIYSNKKKKRFKFTLKPLLLIHNVLCWLF